MPLHRSRHTAPKPGRPSGPQPAGQGLQFPPEFPLEFLLAAELPRDRFPAGGPAQPIHEALKQKLLRDGNARQNLATFCQNWEARDAGRSAVPRAG